MHHSSFPKNYRPEAGQLRRRGDERGWALVARVFASIRPGACPPTRRRANFVSTVARRSCPTTKPSDRCRIAGKNPVMRRAARLTCASGPASVTCVLGMFGVPSGSRTRYRRFKKPLLYPLSYWYIPTTDVSKLFTERAQRNPAVTARAASRRSPKRSFYPANKKAPEAVSPPGLPFS